MRLGGHFDQAKAGTKSPGYALETFSLAGRTQVSSGALPASTVNLVYLGQSQANNSIDTTSTPTHASTIFNTSLSHGGAIFQAVDPLLASDLTGGHSGMYLSDSMITAGLCSGINMTMPAFGGSYTANFCVGGGTEGNGFQDGIRASRIELAARCLGAADMFDKRTITILRLGENSASVGTSTAQMTVMLTNIITEMKRVGLIRSGKAALIIDNSTYLVGTSTAAKNAIRAANAAAVDNVLVFAGADLDSLDSTYRNSTDFAHFKANGATAIAALEMPIVTSVLAGLS
jgi:hypothetical protein